MTVLVITELADDDVRVKFKNRHHLQIITDLLKPTLEKDLSSHDFSYFLTLAEVMEKIDMIDFPKSVFNKCCKLITQATLEQSELAPYAKELKEKLEADPRYSA